MNFCLLAASRYRKEEGLVLSLPGRPLAPLQRETDLNSPHISSFTCDINIQHASSDYSSFSEGSPAT
ncbi:Hypothetical predicted protein [Podarcis lilfordi]|uniref:Uncharacterized protein n=1 Tax=Podarcis lilfordi TaxID=74358 RepID=A0AA35KI45_9SAUR|nr:Hypothetical predicted protein [Podarcis lilfordi]